MKKKVLFTLLIIIVIIILAISFIRMEETENSINDLVKDVKTTVTIDKYKLDVIYLKGNMLDEKISYGNIATKTIEIINQNDTSISFAILLRDADINNTEMTYTASYSETENGTFETINKDESLNSNNILIYNVAIEAKKSIYIKFEFKSNIEDDTTHLKGILSVENNISATELFAENIYEFQKKLDAKIDELNGITVSGYYLININDLKTKDSTYNGYILIDAADYADLKFYYTVYNENYILVDYQLTDKAISKSDLSAKTSEEVKKVTTSTICSYHTKKACSSFNTLKVNTLGGKDVFTDNVATTVEEFKQNFNKTDKKVYIANINNDKIHGYILINNKVDEREYYLYLANTLYMVSGYNMTKYGMFKYNSATVRAYNESAFNLSASSPSVVCSFTGFDECYDMFDEKV